MAKMRATATTVFWPPESCFICIVSPCPKDTLILTPLYFSAKPLAAAAADFSTPPLAAAPGSAFSASGAGSVFLRCITSSPLPPCTNRANTSRKLRETCLNVRSMDSSFFWSRKDISSFILACALSSSPLRAFRPSRCSVNCWYWSRAFLFT